ncbi:ABC transporter substrate-binding protein [Microlunatus sp. GCM10028923]|uniref:ABC transporter substrate-binding protein n=1 Tax=Microlunatus sp. GCM10028923 TaxID=3273400 RepID=UPI003615E142
MVLTRRAALGMTGLAGLAAMAGGCATPGGEAADAAGTRTVEHPLGTAEIPVRPRRVIALDAGAGLQTALEAGAPLIASETLAGDTAIPDYLPKPPEGFQPLGFNEIDLERLTALEPDLIIGSRSRVEELYPQLTKIAPTVSYLNTADRVRWRDTALTVGDLLGARPELERRLTAFDTAAKEFAEQHAESLTERSVALVRFTADEVRILTGVIFPSDLLAQLGARRPASNEPEEADATYISLTRETVPVLADADTILYFSGGGGFAQESGELFAEVTDGPLWRRLPAVKAGRAHQLNALNWWDGYSTSAAQACLTELKTFPL